jgi:hypothetical protein
MFQVVAVFVGIMVILIVGDLITQGQVMAIIGSLTK